MFNVADDYNGEDVGTEMAINDMLADNNLGDEYRRISATLQIAMIDSKTKAQTARKFLSNITVKELIIVANWMKENGHGNVKFVHTASSIVEDAMNGVMNKLSGGQVRCLMGFVRPDVLRLPII